MKTAKKAALVIAAAGAAIGAAPGAAFADTGAAGQATGSWGIGSGNLVQAPVEAPVNVCGTTVNVAGLFNPAAGNSCGDAGGSDATLLAATPRPAGGGLDGGVAGLRGDESGLGAEAGPARLSGDAEGLGLDSGIGPEGVGETRLMSDEEYNV
ncbi:MULTISPECIES: chaplin [Streptomyces]|uniref:Chaplin n=1 Tax=Streptomyces xinghaiensis TaxID=1038928 RepID=A0A3R7JA55_9ACTN|nr:MULTISPECIES: chaplin [Streptomyces]OFA41960.1 hypothetical protein BEN35_24290 [Streptomyces fradiae]PQM25357.1 chaplin [Streptomyces xinghaiensis]RKM99410.1 chaplin [Streptomyces xinghaiensis]RNC75685.1 chaplin [Streptomyces xinghaiensis]